MSNTGAFGEFEAFEDYGIKRYQLDKTVEPATISHAWTERCALDYLTRLCSSSPELKFLSDHVAKFQAAYAESSSVLCLQMERVKGLELNDVLIDAENGLDEEQALKMSCELIQTVALLHSSGMAHRDLKLDNVMVTPDGTPVLIDWGTAHVGDMTQKKMVCGTMRANSIQQLALDAFKDNNLQPALKNLLFGRSKPHFNMISNDLVQLANILSALWTSCTSEGEIICSVFGPEWDEACEELNSGDLVLFQHELYSELEDSPVFDYYPELFCNILLEMVHPDETERISAIEAWRRLWCAKSMVGPSGQKYDLAKFLTKPPSDDDLAGYEEKLTSIIGAHHGGAFAKSTAEIMKITPQQLRQKWEYAEDKKRCSSEETCSTVESVKRVKKKTRVA